MKGYIKLHRKIQKSDMYGSLTSKQRDVFIQCLMLANHKPKKWIWKGKFKVVEVGSTTDLDKKAMMEYIEQIDNFICSFFGVDTSQFFATYQQEFSKY